MARFTYGPFPYPYPDAVIAIVNESGANATLYDPVTDVVTTTLTHNEDGFFFRVEEGVYTIIARHTSTGPSARTRVRVSALDVNDEFGASVAPPSVGGASGDHSYFVPGVPRSLTTTDEGDGYVTVSFLAPLSDGGAPITNYVASVSPPEAAPVTVPGTDTSVTISGLNNLTTYTVTIHAVNVAGSGAESTGVSATPDTARSAHDYLVNARLITATGSHSFDNTHNTNEAGETYPPNGIDAPTGPSAWYKLNPTVDTILQLDTSGSLYPVDPTSTDAVADTILGFYSGPANATMFSQLTLIASNDDMANQTRPVTDRYLSRLVVQLHADQHYYVMATDYGYDDPASFGTNPYVLSYTLTSGTLAPLDAPTNVVATDNGDGTVTVTWDNPADPLNTMEYLIVTASPDERTRTIGYVATETQFIVYAPPAPDGPYITLTAPTSFTVVAYNEAGAGATSDPSNVLDPP